MFVLLSLVLRCAFLSTIHLILFLHRLFFLFDLLTLFAKFFCTFQLAFKHFLIPSYIQGECCWRIIFILFSIFKNFLTIAQNHGLTSFRRVTIRTVYSAVKIYSRTCWCNGNPFVPLILQHGRSQHFQTTWHLNILRRINHIVVRQRQRHNKKDHIASFLSCCVSP